MEWTLSKRLFIGITLAMVAVISVAVAFFVVGNEDEVVVVQPSGSLSEEEMAQIQKGDIVLRMGYGTVSRFLERNSGGHGVSHCAIAQRNDTAVWLIHAISSKYAEKDGVQTCSLPIFLQDAKPNSIVVLRPIGVNVDTMMQIAERYVEANTPFDLRFSMETHDEIFCSELIYLLFKEGANIELFDAQQPDYKFQFFFDTTLFEMVIDQRISATHTRSEQLGSSHKPFL